MSDSTQSLFENQTSTRVKVCELASGGMGRVDLALRREGTFRRLYAVKRLHSHLRDDPEFRAMFVDEARVAGLIEHPNVVGVLDVGEDDEGPFLVMSFVDGLSLATLLSFAFKSGEALPLQAAIRIAIELTKGLHAAHELVDHDGQPIHLVHRDLSPQNVLIGWDGTVRITDFGIAKALGRSTKTATGVVKGKASYMAPEQLRYQDADRRSDLFALGIVIYEMVSNERLYKNRDGHDGIRRILEEPPPDIGEVKPEVPSSLTALLFQLLAKDPESRVATAALVGMRLEEVLAEILENEPPIELPALLEEVAGSYREERKATMAALIAKAERESEEGERVLKVAERPAAQAGSGGGTRLWIAAGVVSVLVAVGAGAWAIGRMGAEDVAPTVDAAPSEATVAPPLEPQPATEPEPSSPSPSAPAQAAPAAPPSASPAMQNSEVQSETTAAPTPPTPTMRTRMRRRRPRMSETMGEEGMTATMETGGSRWDEWE